MLRCLLSLVAAASIAFPLHREHGVLYAAVRMDGVGPLIVTLDPGAGDLYTSYARSRLNGRAPKTICFATACFPASMQYFDGDPNDLDPKHDTHDGVIAGSIGPALLQRYVATIDYRTPTLGLTPIATFRAPPKAQREQLTFDSFGLPVVDAAVNGIVGRFELDVRAGRSMLFTPFLERTALGRSAGAQTVRIAGSEVSGVEFLFSKATSGKFATAEDAGLLGNDVLSHFVLTLDLPHRSVYFER